MKEKSKIVTLTFCLFLSICICSNKLFAAPPVILIKETGKYLLNKHVDILEDKTGTLTIHDVISPEIGKKFIANKKENINFSFSHSAYWLRIKIISLLNENKKMLFEIAFSHQDYIDFYNISDSMPVSIIQTGDRRLFNTRQYPNKNFLFNISTIPGQESFIYLRVQSEDGLHETLPLILWDKDQFVYSYGIEQYFIGIYFGIIIVMAIYNLFIFFSVKDKIYFYYVLYITFYASWLATYYGFSFQFCWPYSPRFDNQFLAVSCCLSGINSVLFSSAFLNMAKNVPKIEKLLKFCVFTAFSIIVFSFFGSYSRTFQFLTLFFIFGGFFLYIAGIICLHQGYKPAKYYLLAWSCNIAGVIILFLKINAILPSIFLTENIFQIGVSFEVILFSLGLADRINQERREKISAQQEVLEAHQKASDAQHQAIENLRKLDKLKDEFLSNIGTMTSNIVHDFKNPVGVIQGCVELIQMDGVNSDSTDSYLEKISNEATRMLDMANELLDFARGKVSLDRQKHNVADFIKDMAKFLKSYIDDSIKIQCDLNCCDVISFDYNKLRRVIYNLGTNARDAMPDGGILRLSIHRIKDNIEIRLSDTGHGIPKEIQPNLFDPFVTFGKRKGTGLGTNIAKKIIDEHGGRIAFETEAGKGTTFIITLPVSG